MCGAIEEFVKRAVTYRNIENHVSIEIQELMDNRLQEGKKSAELELERLCADEQYQPITYNVSCFTELVLRLPLAQRASDYADENLSITSRIMSRNPAATQSRS